MIKLTQYGQPVGIIDEVNLIKIDDSPEYYLYSIREISLFKNLKVKHKLRENIKDLKIELTLYTDEEGSIFNNKIADFFLEYHIIDKSFTKTNILDDIEFGDVYITIKNLTHFYIFKEKKMFLDLYYWDKHELYTILKLKEIVR